MATNGEEVGLETTTIYEVAQGILAQLMGYADRHIEAERAREVPNAGVIAAWMERRQGWAERSHRLQPGDVAGIHAVLDLDGAHLRALRPEHAGLDALASAYKAIAAAAADMEPAMAAADRMVTADVAGLSPDRVILRRLHEAMEGCRESLLDVQVLLGAVLYDAGTEASAGG